MVERQLPKLRTYIAEFTIKQEKSGNPIFSFHAPVAVMAQILPV
jgi:hypothetical protein